MNHDLAAVLDYLDQRFGSTDQQAFEQRLAQEPHLRELLEKTKTMQRNLRSIFGQSEQLVAPSHNVQRLTKFARYKHTINALLIVVLLLAGIYVEKQINGYPQASNNLNYLALDGEETSMPQHQTLLLKGLDHEQNYFVQAMRNAQMMWQANNVEALIIAHNGDRFEVSKNQTNYVLTRRSSDQSPIWQQSLPYESDSSTILGFYSSPDQTELYLTAYTSQSVDHSANPSQTLNIIPKQQLTSNSYRLESSQLIEDKSKSIDAVLNHVASSSGMVISPTDTAGAQAPQQGQASFAQAIELKQQDLIIYGNSGAIKNPAEQCNCRYLESNQTLYRFDQAFPLSNYLDYAISPTNPNLLTILTADQQVMSYDIQQRKTINITKLAVNQQLNQNLHRSIQFSMLGLNSAFNYPSKSIADIQISGNKQTIIIRDSDGYSTSFYAFDRQTGKQLWQNSLLRSIDSFTTNWDGSEVYAVSTIAPTELRRSSTLYTINAAEARFEQYPDQQIEEIRMVYDF